MSLGFYIAVLTLASSMYAEYTSSGEARLSHAYQLGTLEVNGTGPFHLEADFEEKLWQGGTRKGTIVEDWLGPQWKRRVLKTDSGTYTVLVADGISYSDNSSLLSDAEREMLIRFFIPVPEAKNMFQRPNVVTQHVSVKGISLWCYGFENFRKQYYSLPPAAETYCVDDKSDDLRLVQNSWGESISYMNLQPFGTNSHIARTLVFSRPHGIFATIQISSLRSAPELSKPDFSVNPSMTKGLSQKEVIEYEDTLDKTRRSLIPLNLKDHIVLVEAAKRGSKGVTVSITVSPEGRVIDLTILSPVDDAAAISIANILQQLQFNPFTVQGKSVNLNTTLLVLNSPANPKK